jgi:type IX secretion system PorP/SprF family membrane protein
MVFVRIGIVLMTFILPSRILKAQDPVYSQFFNAHLQLNPSLAGNTYSPLIQLNFRNQWAFVPQAYNTYSLSVDKYFDRLNSGFGAMLLADNAGQGALKNTVATLFYSYRLKIKNNLYIKGGMELGFSQLSLDWNKLTFGDAIDIRLGPISPGGTPYPTSETLRNDLDVRYPTLGSGFMLYNDKHYAGVSIKNMNQPDIYFVADQSSAIEGIRLPMRISLHAGTQIVLQKGNKNNAGTFLSPNVTYQYQSGFNHWNAGAYLNVDKMQMGLWYRHAVYNGDALIGSVGVKYQFMKLTYSFDFTTSKLGINNGGSHEVGMIINFDHIYKPKVNYNDCFQIFR